MTSEIKSIGLIWGLCLVFKICLSSFVPLAPDEAYYWVWSHFPDLSYMDHPAMVSWLFYLGKFFSWIPHGQRIPSILMGHLTLLIWLFICRKIWNATLTWRWMIVYLSIPFLGLGSLLVTPDVPVLFFWSLSFLALLHWLERPKPGLSVFLGVCLGLGFCSKYHMVLFVLGFLVFCWREKPTFQKEHRRNLLLVILAGLAASSPVLIWNFTHHWDSFRFQLNHGFGKDEWLPHWTGDYIAGQFLLLSPLLWWLYIKGIRFRSLRLFFWISFVPWMFFLFSSYRGAVQANWPIVSLAPALILVIAAHQNWKLLKAVCGIYLLCSAVVLSLWIYPWSKDAPEKLTEVHELRESMAKVLPYQPLYGGSYQIASILWYYSGHPIYKLRFMSRHDQFDYWDGSLPKESIFFVMREKNEPLPAWLIKLKAASMVILDLGRYELVKVNQL